MASAPRSEDVAIVGLACRFPGADDHETFWTNLITGKDSFARSAAQPDGVPALAPLENGHLFDREPFGMSAAEAGRTPPEQRLFLETCLQALEHAGYDANHFDGDIGVYGACTGHGVEAGFQGDVDSSDMGDRLAGFVDFVATRAGYRLDLTGPCMAIQTACSSSLVAVHQACLAVLVGECDIALAGGSSGRFIPNCFDHGPWQFSPIKSRDGYCRPFDDRASGTLSGEGSGVVVLRPLAAAIEAGDTIWGVIRGSAINNDGRGKMGFTAPSVPGQRRVILKALARADVEPRDIGYIEAHGTGTPLGDPIEFEALRSVFQDCTGPRYVGAVKGVIGHLGSAAGVAGLIKAVLALRHGQIPPNPYFERPNPALAIDSSSFVVNSAPRSWPTPAGSRFAGVSSFGLGGTNAHVILAEAPVQPARERVPRRRGIYPLCLSTASADALVELTRRMTDALREDPQMDLADVCHTMIVGRRERAHRRALLATSLAEATAILESGRDVQSGTVPNALPRIALLFPEPTGDITEGFADEPQYFRSLALSSMSADGAKALGDEDVAEAPGAAHAVLGQVLCARLLRALGVEAELALGQGLGKLALLCDADVWSWGKVSHLAREVPESVEFRQATASHPEHYFYDIEAGSFVSLRAPSKQRVSLKAGDLSVHGALQPGDVVICLGRPRDATSELPEDVSVVSIDSLTQRTLLEALVQLWVRGFPVDFSRVCDWEGARRIPLPTYPFQRVALGEGPAAASSPSAASANANATLRPKRLAESAPDLATLIKRMFAEELKVGIGQLGDDTDFFDLGGESLDAIRLVDRINEELAVNLSFDDFFTARTAKAIASIVANRLPLGDSGSRGPVEDGPAKRSK